MYFVLGKGQHGHELYNGAELQCMVINFVNCWEFIESRVPMQLLVINDLSARRPIMQTTPPSTRSPGLLDQPQRVSP